MILPPEEPQFGPWQAVSVKTFVQAVQSLFLKDGARPGVVAIDGRSAGGKTTLAECINKAVSGSAIVHTDDIAWHHSFFDWSELLLQKVLMPVRAGQGVFYRPAAWIERGREGEVEVPPDCSLLILEGVGAARRELLGAIDVVVWVQSDMNRARTRGLARDIAETGDDAAATAFWDEWMTAELIFQADQRPWERADFVISGTPELEHDPGTEIVVAKSRRAPR